MIASPLQTQVNASLFVGRERERERERKRERKRARKRERERDYVPTLL
jgi:hypothetical protein